MLLHLTGSGRGACLAVCNATCARETVRLLGIKLRTATDGRPPPVDYCRHCVACGGIIDEPITQPCCRHPYGCPAWDYTLSAAAATVIRRFASEHGRTLSDEGLSLLEQMLTVLNCNGHGLDAEAAYRWLAAQLPPAS